MSDGGVDLDALLGPRIDRPGTGAMMETVVRREPARTGGKAQQSLASMAGSGFTVRPLNEEEKRERAALRPKKDPEAKRQRGPGGPGDSQRRMTDEEVRREMEEAALLLNILDDDDRDEKRRRKEEDDAAPGEEKPATFSVDLVAEMINPFGNITEGGGSADALDRKIDVREYYGQEHYPVSALASIITFGGQKPLSHCELGMFIRDDRGADHMWRNQRFATVSELSAYIKRRRPVRIEIGPTHPNSDTRVDASKRHLMRQLVFDIDLEDVDEDHPDGYIRNCRCRGKKMVCGAGCWFHMKVGVKILTYILRTTHGYKHILPVYSGRRGVHVWVMDQSTLHLTSEDRAAIVDGIVRKHGNPRVYWHKVHSPYMYEKILLPAFREHFLSGSCLLASPLCISTIVSMIPLGSSIGTAEEVTQMVMLAMVRYVPYEDGPERLKEVWEKVRIIMGGCLGVPDSTFQCIFVFRVLFPRLDENVTTVMNHLIKAPWVMHPETKRVSVPIPDIDTWKPEEAPRISQIVEPPEDAKDRDPYGFHRRRAMEERRAEGVALSSYVAPVTYMVQRAYPRRGYQPVIPRPTAHDDDDEEEEEDSSSSEISIYSKEELQLEEEEEEGGMVEESYEDAYGMD